MRDGISLNRTFVGHAGWSTASIMDCTALSRIISEGLESLYMPARTVLIHYYGLAGVERMSYTAIGQELLNVPRKMVMLLENKGVNQMRRPAIVRSLKEELERLDGEIWDAVSEPVAGAARIVSKKGSLLMLQNRLPAEIVLAQHVLYSEFEAWLSDKASSSSIAWFRSPWPNKQVLDAVTRLDEACRTTCLPIQSHQLVERFSIDTDMLPLVVLLSEMSWALYDGYVAEKPLSISALRAIRLHLLLCHQYASGAVPDQLARDYNNLYTETEITSEIAQLVMTERPHLFKQVDAGKWNGMYRQETFPVRTEPGSRPYYFERPWKEMTADDLIREILECRGITRLADFLRLILPKIAGRLTPPTLIAALKVSEHFIAFAPQVYGLREHYRQLAGKYLAPDFLLNERDCRRYTIDRFSGESMRSYPLWTPEMEKKWVLWAEKNNNYKLFHSLLSVAEPDLWPSSEEERDYWKKQKQAIGRYYLYDRSPRYPLLANIPSLQEVLTVAIRIQRSGSINWMQINHELGNHHYNQKAASVLSLLVTLNMITAVGHWQRPHPIGPACDAVVAELVDEILRKGFLHWDDAAGVALRQQMGTLHADTDLGWIKSNELSVFLKVIIKGGVSQAGKFSADAKGSDDDNNLPVRPRQMRLFS